MINTLVFKKARRANGYTQKELAKGITTQGTISRIEKDAFEPSRKILEALALRLNLRPNQLVLQTTTQNLQESLQKADQEYKNYQYQHVLDILKPFSDFTSEDTHTNSHLTFLLTASRVWLKEDYDEGIFGFNKILLNEKDSIFAPLAAMELAVVYSYKENEDRSKYYADQVPKLLDKLDSDVKYTDPVWYTIILANLSRFYYYHDNYDDSVSTAKLLIAFLNSINSSFNLESAYMTLAAALSQIDGDTDETKRYLLVAWGLAVNSGNKKTLENTTEEMEKLNIPVF
ncbi:MAG TPA: hypothetical protein DCW31_02840 [Lactobacillus sp.]|nr:hypothetical protein [Lactobacillus sp.]